MFRSSLRDQSGVLPCVNRFGQGRLGYYVRSSLGSPCLAPHTVVPNARNTPKIKLKKSWNWLVNGLTYACNSLTNFRYETERIWICWNLKIREITWGNLIFGGFGPFRTAVQRSSTALWAVLSCLARCCNIAWSSTVTTTTTKRRSVAAITSACGLAQLCTEVLQVLDDSACKHGVPRCRVGAVRLSTMRLWEKQEVQFCSKSVKISNHSQIWPPIFFSFEYGRLLGVVCMMLLWEKQEIQFAIYSRAGIEKKFSPSYFFRT
jgi:hypothetical protein